jgi:hypothetical protein
VDYSPSVQKKCYTLNSTSMNDFLKQKFRTILVLLDNVNDLAFSDVTFLMIVIKVFVDLFHIL